MVIGLEGYQTAESYGVSGVNEWHLRYIYSPACVQCVHLHTQRTVLHLDKESQKSGSNVKPLFPYGKLLCVKKFGLLRNYVIHFHVHRWEKFYKSFELRLYKAQSMYSFNIHKHVSVFLWEFLKLTVLIFSCTKYLLLYNVHCGLAFKTVPLGTYLF